MKCHVQYYLHAQIWVSISPPRPRRGTCGPPTLPRWTFSKKFWWTTFGHIPRADPKILGLSGPPTAEELTAEQSKFHPNQPPLPSARASSNSHPGPRPDPDRPVVLLSTKTSRQVAPDRQMAPPTSPACSARPARSARPAVLPTRPIQPARPCLTARWCHLLARPVRF